MVSEYPKMETVTSALGSGGTGIAESSQAGLGYRGSSVSTRQSLTWWHAPRVLAL